MQPLFIGPYDLGVKQDVTPFMIPDQAFPNMKNAFVWRGRVQRKSGYTLLGRLRRKYTAVSIGNWSSATSSYSLKSLLGITETNAQIQSGFVITLAAPASQTLTDSGTGTLAVSAITGTNIQSATVNYNTGVVTVVWGGATANSATTFTGGYFPGLPAMGIRLYEDPTSINEEKTIFWDTVYAYRFTTDFEELPSTIPSTWTGSDKDQFWTTNYQNTTSGAPLIWATNGKATDNGFLVTQFAGSVIGPPSTSNVSTMGANTFLNNDVVVFFQMTGGVANATTATVTAPGNPFTVSNPGTNVFADSTPSGMVYKLSNTDGIRYYNGTTWNYFTPALDGTPTSYLLGALLIVPYKNRLIVLNTTEGVTGNTQTFRQRARWSQIGDSTDVLNGWRDDLPGRGNAIDAATEESIISCGFVKDELIVYFERSTWKLAYTGNEIGPFTWQRINSELGAESTFSNVQFDAGLICLGNVGVHTCNGSQVQRIDSDIPNEVFKIHNGFDGPQRVSAIRDFYQEIVYFSYPDNIRNVSSVGKISFPNKMMIYNYRNNTFSFFDDNATTFGFFQQTIDTPWSALNTFTWNAWNIAWNAGVIQSGFPSVCFGNQQGFIEKILPFVSSNGPSLMVQNISGVTITSPQHNLNVGQFIRISNATGIAAGINNVNFRVVTVPTENTFTISTAAVGTYTGNGIITVLTNLTIPTKQFTPFWTKGKNYSLKYIDVLVDKTSAGELQVDVYIDFNTTDSMTSNAYVLGSPVMTTSPESIDLPYYSFQQQGQQIWKRFYTLATGETFQIQFSFSDTEMLDQTINESDVVIHAMNMFFEESGEFY